MDKIKTIFYFVENLPLSDYQSMWSTNQIANRTIVFAETQKAIYKGGKQYGVTETEFDAAISDLKVLINNNASNITILGNRISAAEISLGTKASADDLTDLTSRTSNLESTTSSLSAKTTLFATSLADLTDRISSAELLLETKADGKSVYTKTEVDSYINSVTERIDTLSASSGVSSSAITDLEKRLTAAEAALTTKVDASEVYTKTEVDGKIGAVEKTVTELQAAGGVNSEAIADLNKKYALVTTTLASKANASETYTKTEIDGKLSAINTDLGAQGGVNTEAITDLNNKYSQVITTLDAKANASEVYTKDEVDQIKTDLNASAGVNASAITDLKNRMSQAETDLTSKAEADVTYTKTEVDGKIDTLNSKIVATSGVKTKSDVQALFSADGEEIYTSGTASSILFAAIEDEADAKYAGIDVAVTKHNIGTSTNPNYVMDSSVKVDADNIYLNGTTWAELIDADAIVSEAMSDMSNYSFVGTTINGDGVTVRTRTLTGGIANYNSDITKITDSGIEGSHNNESGDLGKTVTDNYWYIGQNGINIPDVANKEGASITIAGTDWYAFLDAFNALLDRVTALENKA